MDAAALSRAGSALDPRAAVLALQLSDVLAPGALAEEARAGGAGGGEDDERELLAARLSSGEAVPVATLLDHPWPGGDRQVALLVRLATRDASYAASLERDLRQIQETGPHPAVARAGAELWVHASTTMPLLRPFARALGFEGLGDLLAAHLRGAAIRAYRHRDGTTAALVLVAPMSQMVECEIQTVLVDGTEVTTSSIMRGGPPRPGASVRREPVGPAALLGLHERHLAEVRGGRDPRPAPATLADFARLLEPADSVAAPHRAPMPRARYGSSWHPASPGRRLDLASR